MNVWRSTGMLVVGGLLTSAAAAADGPDDLIGSGVLTSGDAIVLRVFLKDGSSLISYGEPARVANRVVFSMPTSISDIVPQLHLINLAAEHVDWERTSRYAETARAARYVATHAESQYTMLTVEIGQALNDIALTADPLERLAIVERARKTLAGWPASHFNYREAEVRQMVAILDEAIADLRAVAGLERFDLNFVTTAVPLAPREPLLPRPTPREAIEQTLLAARLADSAAERVSLMSVALAGIERDAVMLPSDWRTAIRRTTSAAIARELETDQKYRALTTRIMALADRRARGADVRGVERLLQEIRDQDETLGRERPEAVASLLVAVDAQLEAARRLRLDRDRWALRSAEFRRYQSLVATPLARLKRLQAALEDIKALAGSTPEVLASVRQAASQTVDLLKLVAPPDELSESHTLLLSAAQLAASAAEIRRDAALKGDLARAWDASSAAAGAIMLADRARADIERLLTVPQLPQ